MFLNKNPVSSSVMSTKSIKTWKEHLLSSGVPLEYSVIRIFEELGIKNAGEYRYERKTEEGVSQIFSVDVQAPEYDLRRDLRINCLVECKYRHDSTKWVFMPQEYGKYFGPDFSDLFVTLDQCCVERQLDRSVLGGFERKYPLCSKGVELLPDDANPKAIEQAVQQLRYAVVASAIEAIDDQTCYSPELTVPIWVIVPIIVTTADLWRLRVDTSLEDVRKADEIASIATPHDVLVLLQEPNHLNRRDAKATFAGSFSNNERELIEELLRQTQNNGLQGFIGSFSTRTPSMFIVISYKRLKVAMTNLHAFFANDRLLKKREGKPSAKKPAS
jgi:hypothetical protein